MVFGDFELVSVSFMKKISLASFWHSQHENKADKLSAVTKERGNDRGKIYFR
jgi:hypothetical protein